jgi:hypothetical protein
MKMLYQGMAGGRVSVVIDGESYPLNPRRDLINYGPRLAGDFGWGDAGAESSQLALAILADYTQDDGFARSHHMAFKRKCISLLPACKSFRILSSEVDSFVSAVPKDAG